MRLAQCADLAGARHLLQSDEMKRLGKAKTAISHCACSNQILASGCCPVCEMEEAGVSIGLGVDGSASNDESNLMQEVRAAFLLQRARYGVGRVSHKDALRWATKGSAACVGRPELGEIAVGKAADLALFKLDELRFSGHGDPLAALVLCGAHRADRVMVGGNWVVTDGAIPGLDVPDLIRRHSAAARAMHGGMKHLKPAKWERGASGMRAERSISLDRVFGWRGPIPTLHEVVFALSGREVELYPAPERGKSVCARPSKRCPTISPQRRGRGLRGKVRSVPPHLPGILSSMPLT
jgi:hypothetical protein